MKTWLMQSVTVPIWLVCWGATAPLALVIAWMAGAGSLTQLAITAALAAVCGTGHLAHAAIRAAARRAAGTRPVAPRPGPARTSKRPEVRP